MSSLTELFVAILVHFFSSHPSNIYDEKLDVILPDFRPRSGRDNSAPLQSDQEAEPYPLLELKEYLQEITSRDLSAYDLTEPG